MRSLPRYAQLYLITMCLLGAATALFVCFAPTPAFRHETWEVVVFLLLAVFAGSKKVRLMLHKADNQNGSMSLGFAVTFAALLQFGLAIGVLIGSVSMLSGCLYPKRQPLHQLLFNVATTATATCFAGLVFFQFNPTVMPTMRSFVAVAAASLAYFAVNTGTVAGIIALCTHQNLVKLWRQTFLWTAPTYFAGAGISAAAQIMFRHQTTALLLFGTPIVYLTYQSYAIFTARAEQLEGAYMATIKSLALAIDAKDQYTHQHILRVQRYTLAIANQMGLKGAELDGLKTGALLHDIGKLGIPEYVLLKPGPLTEEEFNKVKKHPEIGAAILDPVEFPWPVLPVVKYHHEKWNGTGYPEGLKGEAIPLTARILAVADVYDALTSNRSYRDAWTHEKAIDVITRDAGKHFDPAVVEAFLKIINGMVEEMAREGSGPLAAIPTANRPVTSKADQAVRDIQRASSELWALYEVSQTISASLGLEETLEILARKLQAIFPGTACLFLLRGDRDSLRVSTVIGTNREYFENGNTTNTRSVSVQVARRGKSYLGEYDKDDLLLTGAHASEWIPLQSALIVPIIHEGEALGTVNIYHSELDAFTQHDCQLLETIAERASAALYNGLLYDRARSHAITDPLTGLYNLRYLSQYFEARCVKETKTGEKTGILAEGNSQSRAEIIAGVVDSAPFIARRREDAFALLCLDLDSFKPINDNFGHQKGDQVLRDLSQLFRTLVRDEDIVARYGGDEFLIVLNRAGMLEAETLAQRLQEAVEEYDPCLIHPKLGALRLGVSIGYACYPLDGEDCPSLLSAADTHMYRNKMERKLGQLAESGKGGRGEIETFA